MKWIDAQRYNSIALQHRRLKNNLKWHCFSTTKTLERTAAIQYESGLIFYQRCIYACAIFPPGEYNILTESTIVKRTRINKMVMLRYRPQDGALLMVVALN